MILHPPGAYVLAAFICMLVYVGNNPKIFLDLFLNFFKGRSDQILGGIQIIFWIQKSTRNFQMSHFQGFFNDTGFLGDITPKVITRL